MKNCFKDWSQSIILPECYNYRSSTYVTTPGWRISKTPILSRNVDQKSLETEFLIAICRHTGDKWQSKTLFLSIFDRFYRFFIRVRQLLRFRLPPTQCGYQEEQTREQKGAIKLHGNAPVHHKTMEINRAPLKDADQPGDPSSLTKVTTVHAKKQSLSVVAIYEGHTLLCLSWCSG